MKKNLIPERVNEQIVRGTALLVFLIAIVYLISGYQALLILLVFDFLLRVLGLSKISPLVFISKKLIVPVSPVKKRLILVRPKKFAAFIGLMMSSASLILILSGIGLLASLLTSVLALFSFLEAFFGFCAGCRIFGLLIKLGIFKEDLCEDCVFPGGEGI